MTKRLTTLFGLMVIFAMLMAACTPTAAPTTAPAANTAAPAATKAPDNTPVKIVWWNISTKDNEKALLQKAADDFMAKHPGVTIEITVLENENFKAKMTTVMQSGNPPDLFQSWGGGVMNEYAKAGLLRDITADVAKDGWGANFGAGALGVYAFQGKQYGVPHDMGMVGFWYNKDLFAKAGITTPPTTWTELLDAVKKLKTAGITPMAIGGKDKWPGAFMWEYLCIRIGGKEAFDAAYSRKGSFTDPTFVEAGKKLKELVDLQPFQDGFLGATYGDEATLVGNGKAAMELMGQWAPGVEADNSTDKKGLGDKLGWFPFPMVEGGKGNPGDALGGGNGWAVGKNAPDMAIEFLKALTSNEQLKAQAEIGMSVPPVKGGADWLKDPLLKIVAQNAAAAPYFQLYYDQAMPPAVGAVVNDATQTLFAGTATPEEAAKAVEDSAAMELK